MTASKELIVDTVAVFPTGGGDVSGVKVTRIWVATMRGRGGVKITCGGPGHEWAEVAGEEISRDQHAGFSRDSGGADAETWLESGVRCTGNWFQINQE